MAVAKKSEVWVATESCVAEVDGKVFHIHKGITRVRGDSPLFKLKGMQESNFAPADEGLHFDQVTSAIAPPGEVRA